MARKSGWQQFTDNFNSVYNTFTDVAKDVETNKIMKQEEFLGADNKPLAGIDRDRARMRALADVYTKYGDVEGGLKIRSDLAAAEKAERDTEIQRQTMQGLIDRVGLQNRLIGAQTTQAAGAGALSFGRARTEEATRGLKVDKLGQEVLGLSLGNEFTEATQPSAIDATNAANNQTAAESQVGALKAIEEFTDIELVGNLITETMGKNLPEGEAQDALIQAIKNDKNISPTAKIKAIEDIQKLGLTKITGDMANLATNAKAALQQDPSGQALLEYYDTIDDGNTLRFDTQDGMEVIIETRNGIDRVIARGGNRQVLTDTLFNMVQNPGTALSVMQGVAELESTAAGTDQKEASTELIKTQTITQNDLNDTAKISAILKQGNLEAQTELARVQAEQITEKIKSEAGLTYSEKQAQKAFNDFVTSQTYSVLADEFRNDPNGLSIYTNRVRQQLKLVPSTPRGLTDEEWLVMTDQERAAFGN